MKSAELLMRLEHYLSLTQMQLRSIRKARGPWLDSGKLRQHVSFRARSDLDTQSQFRATCFLQNWVRLGHAFAEASENVSSQNFVSVVSILTRSNMGDGVNCLLSEARKKWHRNELGFDPFVVYPSGDSPPYSPPFQTLQHLLYPLPPAPFSPPPPPHPRQPDRNLAPKPSPASSPLPLPGQGQVVRSGPVHALVSGREPR